VKRSKKGELFTLLVQQGRFCLEELVQAGQLNLERLSGTKVSFIFRESAPFRASPANSEPLNGCAERPELGGDR
jgi:hypothetical protein